MSMESYCTSLLDLPILSVIMCYQQPSILVNASLSATEFHSSEKRKSFNTLPRRTFRTLPAQHRQQGFKDYCRKRSICTCPELLLRTKNQKENLGVKAQMATGLKA